MNPTIHATKAESPAAAATDGGTHAPVRDFDELDDHAQDVLHEAAVGDAVTLDEEEAAAFTDGEVVRFTGYYRITVAH
jgi:predicted amino acid racemase